VRSHVPRRCDQESDSAETRTHSYKAGRAGSRVDVTEPLDGTESCIEAVEESTVEVLGWFETLRAMLKIATNISNSSETGSQMWRRVAAQILSHLSAPPRG
jgi:hypothetical protein